MTGLALQKTAHIEQYLQDIIEDASISEDVHALAQTLLEGSDVPWKSLKKVALAARGKLGDSKKLWLHKACVGSGIVLNAPKPRVKSPELQARLALLQKQLEQQQYDAMVQDITHAEREAKAQSEGGIVTYKSQLSVGLHIIVMMGTFFAAGYVGVSYLSSDPMHHVVGGLVGLVFAMLMETILLIIRTTVSPTLPVEALLRKEQRPRNVAAAGQHVGQEEKKVQ